MNPENPHSPASKKHYVEAYQRSGQTIKAFCQSHTLNYYTFKSWLSQNRSKPSSLNGATFLPIKITDVAEKKEAAEERVEVEPRYNEKSCYRLVREGTLRCSLEIPMDYPLETLLRYFLTDEGKPSCISR